MRASSWRLRWRCGEPGTTSEQPEPTSRWRRRRWPPGGTGPLPAKRSQLWRPSEGGSNARILRLRPSGWLGATGWRLFGGTIPSVTNNPPADQLVMTFLQGDGDANPAALTSGRATARYTRGIPPALTRARLATIVVDPLPCSRFGDRASPQIAWVFAREYPRREGHVESPYAGGVSILARRIQVVGDTIQTLSPAMTRKRHLSR